MLSITPILDPLKCEKRVKKILEESNNDTLKGFMGNTQIFSGGASESIQDRIKQIYSVYKFEESCFSFFCLYIFFN